MRLPGDDDLGYVRHQLDDLNLARDTGLMTVGDERRYEELCAQERYRLMLPQNRIVTVRRMVGVG